MCCVVALFAMLSPRLALVFLWLFTNLVSRPFDSWVVPLIGLILLPWTTLTWVLVWSPADGVSGFGWVVVVIGVLADISSYTAGGRHQQDRNQQAA